ncbi:hypothetical protein KsCSTR_09940 [Candidatus Kuenenia stuttgartiensis]|uniref:Uncharacterized protein n=1 Tax=Kuenenia stuttgartiensis TaxID=174633 RepID=A0A6G7GM31_KUEST|nr:hypothetical protein KsCSTR_09940 [Candidatus Kuenenia stuttgartiensis]
MGTRVCAGAWERERLGTRDAWEREVFPVPSLQSSICNLPTADCRLQTSDF